jgi:hypothetical protein
MADRHKLPSYQSVSKLNKEKKMKIRRHFPHQASRLTAIALLQVIYWHAVGGYSWQLYSAGLGYVKRSGNLVVIL